MDVFGLLLDMAKQGRQAEIITVVGAPDGQSDKVGQIMLIPDNDEMAGFLVDREFSAQLIRHVRAATWQQPHVIEWDYHGRYRLFWDRLTAQRRALILGAGHISQPLVELMALVGYEVTVVDDRPDFANPSRFPKAKEIVCSSFTDALQRIHAADYSAVIIVTRGHRYDLDCLRNIVGSPVNYLGMIGSRRRIRAIRELLLAEGIPAEGLARVKAPIGLDIGAQTPEEIALSITSEVIAAARGGSGLPLSGELG